MTLLEFKIQNGLTYKDMGLLFDCTRQMAFRLTTDITKNPSLIMAMKIEAATNGQITHRDFLPKEESA